MRDAQVVEHADTRLSVLTHPRKNLGPFVQLALAHQPDGVVQQASGVLGKQRDANDAVVHSDARIDPFARVLAHEIRQHRLLECLRADGPRRRRQQAKVEVGNRDFECERAIGCHGAILAAQVMQSESQARNANQ